MITHFTSESVASGHPDKICDQISDAVVDAAIAVDPTARVAVETLVTKNRIVMAGEVTCTKRLPYEDIARSTIQTLGYTDPVLEFTSTSPISLYIHEQSPDIAVGVDDGGAGDQGMMFGYACTETKEFMPIPIMLAHRLVEKMDEMRTSRTLPFLRPDGKSEVNVRYENGIPTAVEHVILAVPYDQSVTHEELSAHLLSHVIRPVLESYKYAVPAASNIVINGCKGKWAVGGPSSDTGVTGRKIIVDTYGGFARHGGGCFSGKDPTKVDRSGAYAARFLAKNIVAMKLASKAEVRIAYVIGHREPIARSIETFGTETRSLEKIETIAWNLLDLSVPGIINRLALRKPIYQNSARYGHFGRNGFPWEKIVVE